MDIKTYNLSGDKMNSGPGGALSLMRILGSLSRSISIIRQITPIYKDLQPLIKKTPEIFKRISNFRNGIRTMEDKFVLPNNSSRVNTTNIKSEQSGPIFFR